ncbi:MAG: UvrD-helicase domain-containing protein [Hydrotalea sp.]|nr:UvrD-helicase domain-containing protein [Hydrotalea sp.]
MTGNNLNQPQQDAVDTLDGPLLVLAGAGTGKTRVLTHRLAELIRAERARPYQIMALTFTNKAAKEMKHRTAQIIGEDKARDVWLGTFHSIGARLLRRYADRLGLSSNFTIINQDDQQRLLKNIALEQQLDPEEFNGKLLSHILNSHKDRATSAEQQAEGILQEIFQNYKRQMTAMNAVDFADLIYLNILLWKKSPDVLDYWQNQFQYFLVDEYQDTNHAQYLFLKMLAGKTTNLACVGDDDQSIYSWRGADIGNILSFQKDYPEAKIIRLEENYRSTMPILTCANHVISHNQHRLGKQLFTPKQSNDKVLIRECFDSEHESELIARAVHRYNTAGNDFSTMAILVRTSAQTRALETRLNHLAIPYQVIGGAKFYDREEIKDALAYLRLIHSSADDLAFRRIINKPKRSFGEVALEKLAIDAKAQSLSLFDALQKKISAGLEKSEKIRQLVATITALSQQVNSDDHLVLADMASSVLEKAGYMEMLRTHKEKIESEGRIDNLQQLFISMEAYASLTEYLQNVALATSGDESEDSNKLSLMTIHAAKGLEFPIVFFAGWEEGIFPSPRTVNEEGQKGVEEERRLAYVGITRAMDHLIISHTKRRIFYKKGGAYWGDQQPSRFLKELDKSSTIWQRADGTFTNANDGARVASRQEVHGTMADRYASDRQDRQVADKQFNDYPRAQMQRTNNSSPFAAKLANAKPAPQPATRGNQQGAMTFGQSVSQPDNSHGANNGANNGGNSLVGRAVKHPRFGLGKITDVKGEVFAIHFHDDKSRWVLREFVDVLTATPTTGKIPGSVDSRTASRAS